MTNSSATGSSRGSNESFRSYRSSSDSNIPAADSRTALILIPDGEDQDDGFDFDDDEDDNTDPISPYDEPFELRTSVALPPLSSSDVATYLLSPSLKLGAMLIAPASLPIKYTIPALVITGLISVFCRHLWQMIAKHLRTPDPEEILLDVLARGRGKEGRRKAIRHTMRFCNGTTRVLISALYLRSASDILAAVVEPTFLWVPNTIFIPILLAAAILPLCLAPSLATRRTLYCTNISVGTFFLWMCCIAYFRPIPSASPIWQSRGVLWNGISKPRLIQIG